MARILPDGQGPNGHAGVSDHASVPKFLGNCPTGAKKKISKNKYSLDADPDGKDPARWPGSKWPGSRFQDPGTWSAVGRSAGGRQLNWVKKY